MYSHTENIIAIEAGEMTAARLFGKLNHMGLSATSPGTDAMPLGLRMTDPFRTFLGRQKVQLQNTVKIQSDLAENTVLSQEAGKGWFELICFSMDRKVFPGYIGLVSLPFLPCLLFHFLCPLISSSFLQQTSLLLGAHSTSGFTLVETHCLVLCASVPMEMFP